MQLFVAGDTKIINTRNKSKNATGKEADKFIAEKFKFSRNKPNKVDWEATQISQNHLSKQRRATRSKC